MLTFRRFTLLFFILLLGLNFLNIISGKSPEGFIQTHTSLWYILLPTLYFGISIALAFLPCSNFHHKVICRGLTKERKVSLTFDDGPDPFKTPIVLDILRKNNLKATFFCIGRNINGNENILKQMYDEGHLIGNHTYTHSKWFDLFPARKMRAELQETDSMIKRITGQLPLFFRPPFGVVNPMVSNALKQSHWQAVCWNIRSLDTLQPDPQKTMNKILKKLQPGSIILLHDFTQFTQFHLDELIQRILEKGYAIVPLDHLLNKPGYGA
jgi:peptidoglycan/xylan/chitin deacetylase (PgdA/CDA1 family)